MLLVQVCESTGVVVAPYTDYPQLLSVLLRMLGEGGELGVKRDLLRLLGILGALDPHQHKARFDSRRSAAAGGIAAYAIVDMHGA